MGKLLVESLADWNFGVFALEIAHSLYFAAARVTGMLAFILCQSVCFLPFLTSPLQLSCILHYQRTCSLQMISSGFPICSALTVTDSSGALAGPSKPHCPPPLSAVWHLHSMFLSVYRRKSGLMSVSESLTKQSVASNMRVISSEMVICSICGRGGEGERAIGTHTSRVIRIILFRSQDIITCKRRQTPPTSRGVL